MSVRPLNIIGELINNSYARARAAFMERNPAAYAHLAKLQADLGARYLTLNLDGTARISVRMEEMLALLRNTRLLREMGVRFIAVRSEAERALMQSALLPALAQSEVSPIAGASEMMPVRYGADLLWPIRIRNVLSSAL